MSAVAVTVSVISPTAPMQEQAEEYSASSEQTEATGNVEVMVSVSVVDGSVVVTVSTWLTVDDDDFLVHPLRLRIFLPTGGAGLAVTVVETVTTFVVVYSVAVWTRLSYEVKVSSNVDVAVVNDTMTSMYSTVVVAVAKTVSVGVLFKLSSATAPNPLDIKHEPTQSTRQATRTGPHKTRTARPRHCQRGQQSGSDSLYPSMPD